MTDDRVEPELMRRAARFRVLGLLLERPRGGWHDEVGRLASELTGEDQDIRQAAAAARTATEGQYLAVFGPGATVSPREVTYRGFEDPGAILADLSAFYRAFAFTPNAEEPADHVAVEAGFLGYLHLKTAFARAQGELEKAQVCADAAAAFLGAHLSEFATPLADRLASGADRAPHLVLAARALAARMASPRVS